MATVEKYTFLHLEWEGCSTLEVSGDGELMVNNVAVTPGTFARALAQMATKWRTDITSEVASERPRAMGVELGDAKIGTVTGIFIKGPLHTD